MELISIILPVYNGEQLIERCIESILKQTYKNFELIIVNDGSTDKTLEKIQKYEDERIRIINQSQQGTGQARNAGLKEVLGDYVCFIDSDDTVDENFLKIMYELIKPNNAQIVACSYKENKNVVHNLNKEQGLQYLISLPEKIPMSVWGKLFTKKSIENIQFDKVNHFEDIKFITEVFIKSDKIVYIEKKLYNYIQRENSRSKYFKGDDRMKACLENVKLVESVCPTLTDSYITYSLFNSIAIANRMILNNFYNDELLKNVKVTVKDNIKSVKKSQYNFLKKMQIYLFNWNFSVYKKVYSLENKIGGKN